MVNCGMISPFANFTAFSILLITLVLCQQGLSDTRILVGLAGGTSFNEGTVVVYYNGTHGTVCDDGWDDADAGVVCRQLGFGLSGIATGSAYFGGGSGPVLLTNVTCNGRESTLASCGHFGIDTIGSCTHSEDAGVICSSQGVPVKLVGGTSYNEGIVKVYYNSRWGTVCDDGWDDTDAGVVCGQLGFGLTGTATGSDNFSSQRGKIWLSNVTCFGSESTIARCAHPGVGIIGSCDHSKDAGVRCNSRGENDISVRLSGGISENEGQVEIYYNDEWSTVCGNKWSDTNVEVLCRQLGYVYNSNPIGYYWLFSANQNTKPILLDQVICAGSESTITSCGHLGFNVYRSGCNDSTDIHVHCYGTTTTYSETLVSVTASSTSSRMTPTTSGTTTTYSETLVSVTASSTSSRMTPTTSGTTTLQPKYSETLVSVTASSTSSLMTPTTSGTYIDDSNDNGSNTGAIIGGVFGGILGVILLVIVAVVLAIVYCIRKKRKEQPRSKEEEHLIEMKEGDHSNLSDQNVLPSREHESPFIKHAAEIEKQLEYGEIDGHLLAERLITTEQQQKLSSHITDIEKKRFLLGIVLDYSIENCRLFLNCLEKSISNYRPHEQLYKLLLPALEEAETTRAT